MEKVAILAITKNGIKIASSIKQIFPKWDAYAPSKFLNGSDVLWYDDPTGSKIADLFSKYDALVCLFSLGAVIRLLAPLLKDKKTDPAVLVIDDKASFVISALSGHIGGANELAEQIAKALGATPVITTAADVNKTISVDLLGKEFGWTIDDDRNVTKVSAFMVNEEKIGIYQDCGEKNWWNGPLPRNVAVYDDVSTMQDSDCSGFLIISDRTNFRLENSVVYRPKTLVVGIGLHVDTTKEKILECLFACCEKYQLSPKSIARLASLQKPQEVRGLREAADELGVKIEYFDRDELAKVSIPNPSMTVQAYEGTPSVSEASAIKSSGGNLVVEKQKFPPDLTVAIARIEK
jgi:cobalt-precorrin 5A hydrolase